MSYSLFYKIGNIVIKTVTDCPQETHEPYSLFLCGETTPSVTIKYVFRSGKIKADGNIIQKTEFYDAYDNGNEYRFCYHDTGKQNYYAVRTVKKDDFSFQTVIVEEKYSGMLWTRVIFQTMGIESIATAFGGAVIHASVIEKDGRGIIFTAPCGTGKSTQAELWRKYRNAEIINGDKALIFCENGECFVSGLPFSGSSKICKNKTVPVKAIVSLGQAKKNKISLIKGLQAYGVIFSGIYHSVFDDSLLTENFVKNVSVLRLDCLPDESAVETLENALEKI